MQGLNGPRSKGLGMVNTASLLLLVPSLNGKETWTKKAYQLVCRSRFYTGACLDIKSAQKGFCFLLTLQNKQKTTMWYINCKILANSGFERTKC